MSQRLLVLDDNHGDTESLRRVRDDIADETFDFVVHVGDFTNAVREDRALAAEQVRAVEPLLEDIASHARHGFVWVWGNRDYFGDIPATLTVGTEIPDDGYVTIGDQRFTADPTAVADDVILVTHLEYWRLVDHFEGCAHFCGNTHLGRHRDRRLNSAFLQYSDRSTGEQRYGGYFVVEMSGTGLDVELRSIGSLEETTCERHRERGVQFQPAARGCMYCDDRLVLLREMAATSFYGLTCESEQETALVEDIVDYGTDLWADPPDGFEAAFRNYLTDLSTDKYAPLERAEDGAVRVAEKSYAY